MNFLNRFIEKNIYIIIFSFLFIQPFLDVFTGVCMNYFHISITLSSIVRLLFFIFCCYFLLFINGNKKLYKFVFLIFFYFIFFSGGILLYKGFNVLSFEFKNLLNTFYFPIVVISLIEMFNKYNLVFSVKNIFVLYTVYCILVFIPNIFNIGFDSYSIAKVGSVGWFLSANAVGNILCILLPFVIYYLLQRNINMFFKIICILLSLYVFFSIGTKVPIVGLLLCVAINFIYYFINFVRLKRYKFVVLSVLVTFILAISALLIIPKTSFYKNIQIHKEFLGINSYFDVFKDYKLVDHFIFSQRLTFLSNTNNSYVSSNFYEKVFGIGYIENYGTDSLSTKTIEIDYFDILYRHGFLGFIIYFSIIVPYFIQVFKKLKLCKLIDLESFICIILVLLLAFFSGHVFVAPAVSIFIALIISNILGGSYEKIS